MKPSLRVLGRIVSFCCKCLPTFLVVSPWLQQPQLVVIEVRVAASAAARKERVRKDRAAPVERIRVVMVTSAENDSL